MIVSRSGGPNRRFPPPWTVVEHRESFWVQDASNPFGLGGTVTAGIVSARGRDIGAGHGE